MKLIDKDALVAEIDRRTDELWALIPDGEKVISDKYTKEDAFNLGKYTALESLDKFIDTLEVKEVDLEKSARHYLLHEHLSPLNEILHQADLKTEMQYHKDIASAFKAGYELGLKAKQG